MNGLLNYLREQGVSKQTRDAMAANDRKKFVLKEHTAQAYYNTAMSIGHEVTISQPSLVGYMIDELELDTINNVLELGTGSAWNAAIISSIVTDGSLTTVERVRALGTKAKQLLAKRDNVQVIIGDAVSIHYPHKFDRIIVTAEFMNEKQIKAFVERNAAHFCIAVYPYQGVLYKITKCGDRVTTKRLMSVRFVPVLEGERA